MSLENGEGGLVMPTPLSLGPLGIANSCFYSKSSFFPGKLVMLSLQRKCVLRAFSAEGSNSQHSE